MRDNLCRKIHEKHDIYTFVKVKRHTQSDVRS